jgi:hypothetical protein
MLADERVRGGASVGDPYQDPQSPHVFGPPRSETGSISQVYTSDTDPSLFS